MAVNGVNTEHGSKEFGKGPNCTMLTLRKNLDHVIYCLDANGKVKQPKQISSRSLVVPVKGVTAEPDSESGLGRRAKLYRLRSVAAKDHSADKAPRKARKVNKTAEQVVAEAKAILAEPTTIINITPQPAPVIPTAPVVPPESPETTAAFDAVPATAPVETVTVPVVNITPEAAPVEVTIANETPAPEVTAPVAV